MIQIKISRKGQVLRAEFIDKDILIKNEFLQNLIRDVQATIVRHSTHKGSLYSTDNEHAPDDGSNISLIIRKPIAPPRSQIKFCFGTGLQVSDKARLFFFNWGDRISALFGRVV